MSLKLSVMVFEYVSFIYVLNKRSKITMFFLRLSFNYTTLKLAKTMRAYDVIFFIIITRVSSKNKWWRGAQEKRMCDDKTELFHHTSLSCIYTIDWHSKKISRWGDPKWKRLSGQAFSLCFRNLECCCDFSS